MSVERLREKTHMFSELEIFITKMLICIYCCRPTALYAISGGSRFLEWVTLGTRREPRGSGIMGQFYAFVIIRT